MRARLGSVALWIWTCQHEWERDGPSAAEQQRPDHAADAARRREMERRHAMTRTHLLSLLLAAAAPAVHAGASQDSPAVPWPMTVSSESFESLGSRGYLASVLDLLDRESEALESVELKALYLDMLANNLALVGNRHEQPGGAIRRIRGNTDRAVRARRRRCLNHIDRRRRLARSLRPPATGNS